jgi:prepilin-type N-terminal cleavage/methylation domain-containing protein
MKIVKNHIKVANHSTIERQTMQSTINSRGFTLIELLTAVAIIAILIGLLLPVIQQRREEYAKNKASENLTALLAASQEYFARTGQYPDELADLRGASGTPTGTVTFNVIVTTGRVDGYVFDLAGDADGDGDVDGADFLLVAEPEFPGITGGITLSINRDGLLTGNPTPGAEQAREQMFNGIRAKAAETVVNLLKLDNSATSQVRGHCQSPDTLAAIADHIDSDDDGRVSVTDVRFAGTTFDDEALRNPLQGFLNYVAQEMKWDSLSEDASRAIFVATGDVNGDGIESLPLFSYDGLGRLTQTYSTVGALDLNDLFIKLEEAEAAEASGNRKGKAKALKAYQKAAKAQIGHAFTRNNANILITLSKTL